MLSFVSPALGLTTLFVFSDMSASDILLSMYSSFIFITWPYHLSRFSVFYWPPALLLLLPCDNCIVPCFSQTNFNPTPPKSTSKTAVWHWQLDGTPTTVMFSVERNEVWCNGEVVETTVSVPRSPTPTWSIWHSLHVKVEVLLYIK